MLTLPPPGETQAYTIGDIGGHRCVVTKLPMTGHSREASIASGSSTTRLLGTFQGVEYVLIVGVGGGVPHYTDYSRHVRLGDVVMSGPGLGQSQQFIYQYCQTARLGEEGEVTFETKSWCPAERTLQEIAGWLVASCRGCEEPSSPSSPWQAQFNSAQQVLAMEDGPVWARPEASSDKLYMSLGGGDLIEVGHPAPLPGTEDPRQAGLPLLHLGPVAAGRGVALDDQLRQEFAYKNGVLAYDSELDSVVESVYGNRKDHYILIRGIADYKVSYTVRCLPSLTFSLLCSGRVTAEGLAALRGSDGGQRGQVHHPQHPALMAASGAGGLRNLHSSQ